MSPRRSHPLRPRRQSTPRARRLRPEPRDLPPFLRRLRRTRAVAAALTHPSLTGRGDAAARHLRQRLELLGDAVWNLAVIHHLLRDAAAPRADLAHRKAQLAGAPFMAEVARRVGLPQALRIGPGPDAAGLRDRPSVLAGTLEAVLGAWYLQAGLAPVSRFVGRTLAAARRGGWLVVERDAKSELQQVLTRRFHVLPTYRILERSGSAHAPEFLVEVAMGGAPVGTGRGRNRRAAEQAAARAALEALPHPTDPHKI
jgi:ribonuclease-3